MFCSLRSALYVLPIDLICLIAALGADPQDLMSYLPLSHWTRVGLRVPLPPHTRNSKSVTASTAEGLPYRLRKLSEASSNMYMWIALSGGTT